MRIELKKNDRKSYYKEAVNIVVQLQDLLKNPDARLKDRFKEYLWYFILSAAVTLMILVLLLSDGPSVLEITALAIFLVIFILLAFAWLKLRNLYTQISTDKRSSTLLLDENGVSLEKGEAGNTQTVRLDWKDVAFVRAFSEAFGFFPKDAAKGLILLSGSYKEEVLQWMKENAPGVELK